ncbi:hypothetical protein EW146_g4910 [Bondarzewia mesenterica]|uniref:DNA-directed RNA polymerase III subunit RPC3 n=1 Tax=Bondarzewia mesenterica TaxID=1095465 RepID=A0A4S4LU46_9AGAM|nr:hypothetical protein EW146_g4910 [Bondarzewia mesenterica]
MADADTTRLCVQIIHAHFGPLTSTVASTLLARGRLSLPQLIRYSSLKPRTVRAAILVLVQHNILWHAQSDDEGEVFEVNIDECLVRLRFGRYVWQTEQLFGSAGADIVRLILDHGKLRPPDIMSQLLVHDPKGSAVYTQALYKLVTSSYLKPSTLLSHISPRDKRIKYEAQEKSKISGFPTAKELREAKETAEVRLKREEEEAEKVGLKRKAKDQLRKSSKPRYQRSAVEEEIVDDDVYFRVNYEKFNIHIRNKLIETAARERYNDGAAFVIRAALKSTEGKQKSVTDIRSDATTIANIAAQIPDDYNLASGLVLSSSKKPKTMALIKDYLGMLAFTDNPTPAGRAASFISSGESKHYVEFEIIGRRLRRRVLEAVTRERHGDDGVRILRLLLDTGKVDEKQISKVTMLAPKDVRPLLGAMSAESLISIQEVPKSADRNPTRTFYLWYVDLQKAYSVLLVNLYKTLHNISMRRRAEEEEPGVKAVLEKRQRKDVSQDESLLTRNERETLAEWEGKRERLTVLEARVEEASAGAPSATPATPPHRFNMGTHEADVELGEEYKLGYEEEQALLPTSAREGPEAPSLSSVQHRLWCSISTRSFTLPQLIIAFVVGGLASLAIQYASSCLTPSCSRMGMDKPVDAFAPPYVGSTEVHNWPPPSPTNNDPTLFPTNVGHAGVTPTGAEAALIATAPYYPIHTGAAQLVAPATLHSGNASKESKKPFDLFKYWGNLSPWYSVKKGAFGIDSGPEAPDGCSVTGLHFLHRHGARYPTSWAAYGGPAVLAGKLHETAANWTAKNELDFLNGWTYKLGEEVLTPFGRQQLFDLGISIRLKYGFLLENFTDSLPVFRTESQDRMLASAMNFASGFFGIPYEDKYLQSITIEADDVGVPTTFLCCPNSGKKSKSDRGTPFLEEWAAIYLRDARDRLQNQIEGYTLTFEDVYTMQQMCPYETVAIGFSKFCGLFTEEEWEGFDYAMDIFFWYNSAFGSPVARVQGLGYIQELVARLSHTPIETHNSSTNATLNDNPVTFPLNQSLYVDATHEVVVLNVITALNLTSFAAFGPLPTDHIPKKRFFRVSELAPFSTNIQFQLLSCPAKHADQIRIIINDAVAPLTGIQGCPSDSHGMCPVDTFVEAQKKIIANTDWIWSCHGDWEVPAGHEWNTTTGDAPGVKW